MQQKNNNNAITMMARKSQNTQERAFALKVEIIQRSKLEFWPSDTISISLFQGLPLQRGRGRPHSTLYPIARHYTRYNTGPHNTTHHQHLFCCKNISSAFGVACNEETVCPAVVADGFFLCFFLIISSLFIQYGYSGKFSSWNILQ